MSAFEKFRAEAWKHQYKATLLVGRICGGTPSDPNVAEGWIKSKLGVSKDELLQRQVAEIMVERGISADEAVEQAAVNKHLNGFKRGVVEGDGQLYIEGRQVKAAIKEAASVAAASDKIALKSWGKTRKGLLSFVAEHVQVLNDKVGLGVAEPTGIDQHFVHTWRGAGIRYVEYVDNVKLEIRVQTDYEFSEKDWAMIWLTGEFQGLGSNRSQGYGRYQVLSWDKM